MFDQSFSATNFRRIFDYMNRKGVYLEGRFFPSLHELTNSIKAKATSMRELRKSIRDVKQTTNDQGELATLKAELKSAAQAQRGLRDTKEQELMRLLEAVSANVATRDFTLGVKAGSSINGKTVYAVARTPESYFALKHLQYCIYKLYKVRQSNRHHILCSLREMLRDQFPKYVVRTDLSGFYESIDRSALLKQLAADSLLTTTSKVLIKQLLWEYGRVSGETRGVPRGIGLSAYLAELHMRRFDELVQSHPRIAFYARYVDDIVAIFVPSPHAPSFDFKSFRLTCARALKEAGLAWNPAKTKTIQVTGANTSSLDYLGYHITFGDARISLRMTQSKIDRIRRRIDQAFKHFDKLSPHNECRARRLLRQRIRFLTGNTRLYNNKKHAVIGSYFSNSLLSSTEDLRTLDAHLRARVNSLASVRLRAQLGNCSFEQGFHTRRFHRFTTKQISEIVKAWKHGP